MFSTLVVVFCFAFKASYTQDESAANSKNVFGLWYFPSACAPVFTGESADFWRETYGQSYIVSNDATLFYERVLGEKVNLGFGLGYYNSGYQTSSTVPEVDTNSVFGYPVRSLLNQHGVEARVYGKYYFKKRLYLTGGVSFIPYVSHIRKHQFITVQDNKFHENIFAVNPKDEWTRKFNAAASLAIGYKLIDLKRFSFALEFRMNHSFIDNYLIEDNGRYYAKSSFCFVSAFK